MNNQKGISSIAIILIIIGVLAAAAVVYFGFLYEKSELPKSEAEQDGVETKITEQPATIKNLAKYPAQFLGEKVKVSGKLVLTSKNYFPSPEFGISDGTYIFPVSPWLLIEIPPSYGVASQPKTMQDFLNQNLTFEGIVKKGSLYPDKEAITYLDVLVAE